MASINRQSLALKFENKSSYHHEIEELARSQIDHRLMIDDKGHIIHASWLEKAWETIKGIFGGSDRTRADVVKVRALSLLEYGVSKQWLAIDKVNAIVKGLHLCVEKPVNEQESHWNDQIQSLLTTIASPQITKLQAAFRGKKTRNIVVLPDQILPFLQQHLGKTHTPEKLLDIARGLCREINEFSADQKKYKGKSIRLDKLKPAIHKYPVFKDLKRTDSRDIQLDFDCWIEMDEKASCVRLLIAGQYLRGGTYKSIFRGNSFEIPLKVEKKKRDVNYEPNILIRSRLMQLENGVTIDSKSYVIEGIKSHNHLLELFPKISLVELPQERLPDARGKKTGDEAYEAKQKWYNCDLFDICVSSSIPLDFSENPVMRRVSMTEKIGFILEIAEDLIKLHKSGIVHRDIKPANILIDASGTGKARALLNDFDLTANIGENRTKSEYQYWDKNCREGIVTPFADCYGLAMSLGDVVIPNFQKFREKPSLFEEQIEMHKLTAMKEFAKAQLGEHSSIYKEIENCQTIQSVHSRINAIMESTPALGELEKVNLFHLNVHMSLIDYTFAVISEVYNQNKNVYEYLQNNPDKKKALEKGSPKEKNEVVEKLQTMCYTMTQFKEEIQTIYQFMNSYIKE